MINRILFSSILVMFVLCGTACGTIATPEWEPPTTAAPPLTPVDPSTVQVGRWQWISFTSNTEAYPPAQLWIDVDDTGSVNGVLSIYPNYPEIPQAALTLIQQNGCNFTVESLGDAAPTVSGFFYSATQARMRVNVTECNVKFYGPVSLLEPLSGEFDVAYNAELTDSILNPRELTRIERGQRVFAQFCSACHGAYAEGMPGIPALNTDQVRSYTDEQLDTIIRNGVPNTVMPAWGVVLSLEDFAGVIELVRNIEILGE